MSVRSFEGISYRLQAMDREGKEAGDWGAQGNHHIVLGLEIGQRLDARVTDRPISDRRAE